MSDAEWSGNYFNYFTEIEDRFRIARGTGLFLLSPLDWALIETWRTAGISLEAVLQGIDNSFAKWRSRKGKRQAVNSLAYCAQAVVEAASRVVTASANSSKSSADLPFSQTDLQNHLAKAACQLRAKEGEVFQNVAANLEDLADSASEIINDLEGLEQRLSVLEDKVVGYLRAHESEEKLLELRRNMQTELRPYRSKMTADQLALLERRYLETSLLEQSGVPRLSLFYLLQS